MNDAAFSTLAELAPLARARLAPAAWAYVSGGAADEHTLRDNATAWGQLRLLPRVLQPLAGHHTRVELLGRTLAHPLLLAPLAYQRLAHPEGERATALAAAAQGAGMVLSCQSSVAVEEVASAFAGDAQAGPLWLQLSWLGDRGATRALAQRAQAAGCQALVLTVDAPVQGVRDRERRAGFALPPGVAAVHLAGGKPAAGSAAQLAAQAPGWDDVAWLQAQTRLPLLLKGVLHPADARLALGLGVAGLVVSNHGGRTLDTVLPTAQALPRLADALGGALPLLVDGGIRRGTDVLKALALGASAVLLGRPQVLALAAGGAPAVARMLRLLRDEFAAALLLAGCATPAQVSRELLA